MLADRLKVFFFRLSYSYADQVPNGHNNGITISMGIKNVFDILMLMPMLFPPHHTFFLIKTSNGVLLQLVSAKQCLTSLGFGVLEQC